MSADAANPREEEPRSDEVVGLWTRLPKPRPSIEQVADILTVLRGPIHLKVLGDTKVRVNGELLRADPREQAGESPKIIDQLPDAQYLAALDAAYAAIEAEAQKCGADDDQVTLAQGFFSVGFRAALEVLRASPPGEPTEEPPQCENCQWPTKRSCPRCGQRICRKCATDHPIRNYDDPPELWRPCK